jgi:hypothetical protein
MTFGDEMLARDADDKRSGAPSALRHLQEGKVVGPTLLERAIRDLEVLMARVGRQVRERER